MNRFNFILIMSLVGLLLLAYLGLVAIVLLDSPEFPPASPVVEETEA